MRHRLLLIFSLTTALGARAQAPVPNDDIANRLPLLVGEPHESRTDGCTVEWGCVDEKLTGHLIDYHNDQWFSFRPPRAGQYFVSLSGQRCRETRGVQLIVLTAGEACQPSTYTILSATSLGTQDDIFVPLTAAEAHREILLCVDGYLRDYCRFRLSIDTVARGVPAVVAPLFGPATQTATRVVELTWTLPDSLTGVARFGVRRRAVAAPRAAEVAALPVRRNAVGETGRAYAVRDTLPAPGQYVYQVVAEGAGPPVLVQQRAVWFRGEAARWAAGLPLPLDRFQRGAELRITITDAASGRVLRRTRVVRPRRGPAPNLAVAELAEQGVARIRVSITGLAGGTAGQGVTTEEFETAL